MAQVTAAARARAVLLFLIGSVGAGVLVSLLAVPSLLVATSVVNTAASDFDQIALDLITPPQPQASKVYMADGSLLTSFSSEYREIVTMDQIAPIMAEAQVAIEDKRFYQHGAIDPVSLLSAAVGHFTGQTDRGASSITQQYVKMVRVQIAIQNHDSAAQAAATAQTLSRKIVEMRYAMALEKQLSKTQILERYLNMAYYGGKSYGVQAAAFHYFGVSAKDLTLPEAAMLAGLVQAPSAYDPTQNPAAAIERRNVVLDVMAQDDIAYITPAQRDEAKAVAWDPSRVQYVKNGCLVSAYPFICQYVQKTLVSDAMAPSLGLPLSSTVDQRQTAVDEGGYSIQTVIDPAAQDAAQQAVSARVAPQDPAIGVAVLLQPQTGLILAMAQSRPTMGADTASGQTFWNYAVPNDMGGAEGFQAGSSFKIFTLASALSLGVPFASMYVGAAPMKFSGQTFQSCAGPFKQPEYIGHNSEGSMGAINLPTATADSVNTYFVQLERDTGICGAVKMAQAAGMKLAKATTGINGYDGPPTDDLLQARYDYIPTFTLGVAEVAPLSMAEAFGTFANNGTHCNPIILQSVKDRDGKDVPVPDAQCTQTIDPNIAAGVTQLLQGVLTFGTGRGDTIPGGYPQVAKSGTSENGAALSFGGYTPNVAGYAVIGVDKQDPFWNGRNQSLRNLKLPVSGTYLQGYGGPDAGKIWQAAMKPAVQATEKDTFPKYIPIPSNWKGATVSPTAPPPDAPPPT